eukprot:8427210-Alexandrium_andersonii.AAC.1
MCGCLAISSTRLFETGARSRSFAANVLSMPSSLRRHLTCSELSFLYCVTVKAETPVAYVRRE